MGESNTVVSAYTMYRHLQQSCSHPSIYVLSLCICHEIPPYFLNPRSDTAEQIFYGMR